jgi:hypothetical protein
MQCTDVPDPSRGIREPAGKNPFGKGTGVGTLAHAVPIRLVEHVEHVAHLAMHFLDEPEFLTRDRRVSASTTMAASMQGTNASVARVLASNTDPTPGVSTRHRPDPRSGLGTNTSTARTLLWFPGFADSLTNSANLPGSIDSQSACSTRTRAARGPSRTIVGMLVTGIVPTGSTGQPTRALISVDLPRLNCPTIAT